MSESDPEDDRNSAETESDRSRDGATEREAANERIGDRLLTGPAVLDVQLPGNVRATLGRFFGDESIETLADWAVTIREYTDGESIAVEDLCHADGPTEHWGEMNGERYYFACFYDAAILSALTDRPVDIRTESPDGTEIEARAVGTDELTVAPESAVFSLGIDETVESNPDEDPCFSDVYAAVCPYVRAFPDPESYEQWSEGVPATTVATPLGGATEFAAALVE